MPYHTEVSFSNKCLATTYVQNRVLDGLLLIRTTPTHRFYIHNVISKQRKKKGMSTYVFRIQFTKRCSTLQKVLWSIFFLVKTRTNSCQKENNICLLNSFYKNAPFSKNVGLFSFYLLLLNTNLSEDGCRLYVSPNAGKSQRRARACLQFGAAVCLQFREGEWERSVRPSK